MEQPFFFLCPFKRKCNETSCLMPIQTGMERDMLYVIVQMEIERTWNETC
jgi:hypothetical protein